MDLSQFADESNTGYEKMRGVKDGSIVFDLSWGKNEVAINQDGKSTDGAGLGVNQRFIFGIAKFGSLFDKDTDMSRRLLDIQVRS